MKKCIICLLICCCKVCFICAMDPEKPMDINQIDFISLPAASTNERTATPSEKPLPISPESWDGSCEQVCGFWTCSCLSVAGFVYVYARLPLYHAYGPINTGVPPRPTAFNGILGSYELPPEQQLMSLLLPIGGALACASHTDPDYHSCLLGNARTAGRKIRQVYSGLMRRLKNSHNSQTTYDPDVPQAGILACLHQQNDGKKTE